MVEALQNMEDYYMENWIEFLKCGEYLPDKYIKVTQGPNPRLFQGMASFNPHTSLADRTTDSGFTVEEMKTQSS